MKLVTETGMMLIPTMVTVRPVTMGGKRKRRRLIIPASPISTSPAKMIIPRIRGKPPLQAACMETAR